MDRKSSGPPAIETFLGYFWLLRTPSVCQAFESEGKRPRFSVISAVKKRLRLKLSIASWESAQGIGDFSASIFANPRSQQCQNPLEEPIEYGRTLRRSTKAACSPTINWFQQQRCTKTRRYIIISKVSTRIYPYDFLTHRAFNPSHRYLKHSILRIATTCRSLLEIICVYMKERGREAT